MTIRKTLVIGWGLSAIVLLGGCAGSGAPPAETDTPPNVPDKAEDVRPVLVGQPLPTIVLRTPNAVSFDLNAAIAEKPAALIFYRGGWCPYCNAHLSELQSIESQIVEAGFQIVAISPDRPEKLRISAEEHGLKYRLLSDSKMTAAAALGIAFRVDDATVEKYRTEYGIDLEGDSGQTHHLLPVPSVFLVDTEGVIRFSHVNPDYKTRIETDVLLEAAKTVTDSSKEREP